MGRDERGRWTKGTSGNPTGRPPNTGLKDAMLDRLEQLDDDGVPNVRKIAVAVIRLACEGDMRAVEFLGRRCWPERFEVDHAGDSVVRIIDLSGGGDLTGVEAVAAQSPAIAPPAQPPEAPEPSPAANTAEAPQESKTTYIARPWEDDSYQENALD